MRSSGRRFEVDKAEGKFLGVCAGIANYTNVDATIVRVALVVVTLMGAFPWTVLAYFAAAYLGRTGRSPRYAPSRIADRREARHRMRNLDLRMQAVETYVTSSNSRLAREIEELR
ncbi:MAG TPA: PspC domain-containing protein [Allosphingosinicella sp.]|jgi:phage shock protein C